MSFEPLGARVVVVREKPIVKTAGGILMPEVVQETLHTGPVEATVSAVGPDCWQLAVGDKVMIPKGAGTEVSDDGEFVTVMLEEDVLLVIE